MSPLPTAPRFGLQKRFLVVVAVSLGLVLVALGLLWQRQNKMQGELVELSRGTLHAVSVERLRQRGLAGTRQLAHSLVNPMYYSDLEQVGNLARSMLRQPDVDYVLVFDPSGNILHDGSEAITSYGKAMQDEFSADALTAATPVVQQDTNVLDVAAPVMIGGERLGGVRVGYSLSRLRDDEAKAEAGMRTRMQRISDQQLSWIAALLLSLLGLAALVLVLVQRELVRPIRELALAARRIEGGDYAVVVPDSPRRDEVGDLQRAFARMGSSIAQHDRDIRRMAYTDALTGLPNRLAFREALDARLPAALATGRGFALLFADIDDFKRVNDTLGHDAGDEALLQIAQRLRETAQHVDGADTLLARFGGDEFVLLIGEAAGADDLRERASLLADALVAELARPVLLSGGRPNFLGASIGVTLFPQDAGDATALLKNGDIAMYQAKVAGKSCHRFYSRAMDQAVGRRVQLEHDLRGAWERGELSLVYQPVYRLRDGRIVGAEALLRWQHPVHGKVSPSVFIDVAEQSGLIETIGPQVLCAACADAMRWGSGPSVAEPLFVSVNLSPRQLRAGDLPEQVAQCLAETGLPASRLHLELTETAVIGDELNAGALLSQLRSSGVKIWLDDFGTGFSGLSHLRRVPVDGVKIDRSFVADMLRDPDDLALTAAIISMAHALGITVVAEGVEQEGQYALLRDRQCDLAQGFWLGHPMTMQDFSTLLL
jgi:diguanylate cyclase (GGDEF)-like protein